MNIKKIHIGIDVVFTFIVITIISYTLYSFFCTTFPKFNFDSQIPLTQIFASSNGFLPYRDIYFPYGILSYLKHDNFLIGIIYIFLLPTLSIVFLLFFKKLWSNNLFAYISFFALVFFVIKFPGIDIFMRYGIIAVLGLLFSYIFSKETYISFKKSLLNGLLVGIVFSLAHDQGIYAIFLFLFLSFFNPLIRVGLNQLKKRSYYTSLFFGTIYFILGIILGFLPFFVYLIYNKIFVNFLQYLWHLKDFPIYAKTPFIPYSATSDNLFTFGILFISIFFIAYRIFYKRKFSLSFYLILNYVIIIILLEQKSLVRSLDVVITFLAFVLFVGLTYECFVFLKNKKISDLKILSCYFLLIIIVLFKLNLHPFTFSMYSPIFTKTYEANACLSMNVDMFLAEENKYKKVERSIRESSKFSGKIFSYLTDPIFYNLFNQKPPYYFTIFEATPHYAQKENIKYIEENNVSHIIYNMNIVTLQDGVPDYARGNLIFKYIINNFIIKENIENLLIFEKRKIDSDFFEDEKLRELSLFQKYLLNINLGAIPRSEGMHKAKNIYRKKHNLIISSNSTFELYNFFKKNSVTASEKVLVLSAKKYKKNTKETSIVLKTSDGKSTTIVFLRCNINKPCVVNLSNIPLFYKERIIKEIVLDDSFDGQIDLLNNRTEFELW